MATQVYWMGGDANSTVQLKVTVDTNNWSCRSIQFVNTDPTRTFTWTAKEVASPFRTVSQSVNRANTPVTVAVNGAFTMIPPSLDDAGQMGGPGWPLGWTISGHWA